MQFTIKEKRVKAASYWFVAQIILQFANLILWSVRHCSERQRLTVRFQQAPSPLPPTSSRARLCRLEKLRVSTVLAGGLYCTTAPQTRSSRSPGQAASSRARSSTRCAPSQSVKSAKLNKASVS